MNIKEITESGGRFRVVEAATSASDNAFEFIDARADLEAKRADLLNAKKRVEECVAAVLSLRDEYPPLLEAYELERDRFKSEEAVYGADKRRRKCDEEAFNSYKISLENSSAANIENWYGKLLKNGLHEKAPVDPSKVKYAKPPVPIDPSVEGPFVEYLQKLADADVALRDAVSKENDLTEAVRALEDSVADASDAFLDAVREYVENVRDEEREAARRVSYAESVRKNTIACARGMVKQGEAVLRQMGEKV